MLIKNGLIVSPGNQLEQPADLRIRNGIIETIAAANSLTAEPDEQVLDASSLGHRAGTDRHPCTFP